jgi:hypothetical protein
MTKKGKIYNWVIHVKSSRFDHLLDLFHEHSILFAPPTNPPTFPDAHPTLRDARLCPGLNLPVHSLCFAFAYDAMLGQTPPDDAILGEEDLREALVAARAARVAESKQAEERTVENARKIECERWVKPCD